MIKILIDSASDIERDEAQKMGLSMIPMEIGFGGETFLDGVDLSHEQFFEKLIESDALPKTSQINEYRWGEAFENMTKSGDQVIAITISSKLSGTFACAKKAARRFAGKVFVVDSLNAAAGERILGEYALRLLKDGRSAEAVVMELDEKKKKIQVLGETCCFGCRRGSETRRQGNRQQAEQQFTYAARGKMRRDKFFHAIRTYVFRTFRRVSQKISARQCGAVGKSRRQPRRDSRSFDREHDRNAYRPQRGRRRVLFQLKPAAHTMLEARRVSIFRY